MSWTTDLNPTIRHHLTSTSSTNFWRKSGRPFPKWHLEHLLPHMYSGRWRAYTIWTVFVCVLIPLIVEKYVSLIIACLIHNYVLFHRYWLRVLGHNTASKFSTGLSFVFSGIYVTNLDSKSTPYKNGHYCYCHRLIQNIELRIWSEAFLTLGYINDSLALFILTIVL